MKQAIKETMKAAAIDRFGGPEVLTIHTLPVPKISAREVLIALDYAGVGIWDAWMRKGDVSTKKFPLILGTDGAGYVVAKGSQVRRFKVGDRAYSYSYENPKGGFYAEYVAVVASKVGKPPAALDNLPAGAIATIGLTALQGVDDVLELRRGESVIVHGASGNVGMLAVQFAKSAGARVLAIASGRDGVRFVHALGIADVIDGKHDDIRKTAREFAPDGVDAVLAFASGPQLTACMDSLRKGGRLAYPNGVEPAPRKRNGVKVLVYDAIPGAREFERLGRAIETQGLIIPIAKVYKLKDAAKAHARIEKGHVLGKIVLEIR